MDTSPFQYHKENITKPLGNANFIPVYGPVCPSLILFACL